MLRGFKTTYLVFFLLAMLKSLFSQFSCLDERVSWTLMVNYIVLPLQFQIPKISVTVRANAV